MSTVSISKGRGYLNHNDRTINRISDRSWNPELSHQNIVYKNEPIQKIYDDWFGEALAEYNQHQIDVKHPERQIKNYYEHISRSKQEKPFYEYVVAFGNINDKSSEKYPVLQQCLDEYNRGFQERNPNFVVFQQITHRDEKGIDHTHIDFVPVSTNNTRGLDVKNSFRGALREMGWSGKTAFLDWRQSEEKVMANILERHGLEFERGSGRDEHLNVRQYQAEAREVERLAQEKLKTMSTPDIPEPEIKINPITKKETVKFQKADFDKINEKISYLQTQNALLEAQKSDLSAKLEKNEHKLANMRKKPYTHENERLKANLEKSRAQNKELIAENTFLWKDNNDFHRKIVDLQDELKVKTEQVKKLEPNQRTLNLALKKNTSLQNDYNDLKIEYWKIKDQIGPVETIKKENSELKTQIKSLKEKNKDLKSAVYKFIDLSRWIAKLISPINSTLTVLLNKFANMNDIEFSDTYMVTQYQLDTSTDGIPKDLAREYTSPVYVELTEDGDILVRDLHDDTPLRFCNSLEDVKNTFVRSKIENRIEEPEKVKVKEKNWEPEL